jgi:hyperosmotically inducible protein
MRNPRIRQHAITLGLIAALAAAPLASVAAQDAMAGDGANQTVPDKAADAWITTKVKTEFATTKGVDATDISVNTHDGVVVLTGHVASAAEKTRADQVARSVKGVKSVDTSGLTMTASGE